MSFDKKPCSLSIIVLIVGSSAAPLHAVVTSWRFGTNGRFNDATRWDVGVPTSRDIAVFDRGATYTVNFPAASLQRPTNFTTDVLLVRDNVTFVDSLTLGQRPNNYVVNRLTIGDALVPGSARNTLNTTLASFSSGTVTLAEVPGSHGTLNVNGGRVNVGGNLIIGNQGGGTLNVTGGVLNQTGGVATLGLGSGPGIASAGDAKISGPAATWMTTTLIIGDGGPGTLIIENGGSFVSGSSSVGVTSPNRPVVNEQFRRIGTVTIGGTGSTWASSGFVTVGGNGDLNTGQGTVNINLGGTATLSGLSVRNNGTLNLNGGQLNLSNLVLSGNAAFNFNAGTLRFRGDRPLDDGTLDSLLGPAHTIGPLQHLAVENLASLNTSLIVDGGTFSAGRLANSPLLGVQRGTLNLTNQAVIIETGDLFGDVLDLPPDVAVNVALGTTNRGLVTGDGQIGGPFRNGSAGVLRAEPGRSLTLTGAGNANDGQIHLFGGLADFTQDLTNSAGALISGNGTLRVGGGLVNQGVMNFSGPANIIGDVTNAAAGQVIASGGGPTTFFDDVVNDGEIRTSPGSFSVFFGALSGAGQFTNTGTVLLEGDLQPGASPGRMSFGGDLTIGPDASLEIEIAGTLGGTEHDVVNVAGAATLGGDLRLNLIDGFVPGPTDTFTLLQADSVQGAFDNVVSGKRLQLSGGGGWFLVHYGDQSRFNPTQVVLSDFQVVGLAGDFNGNNLVEQADLDFVLLGWGQDTPPVPSGWDYDLPRGVIDQGELDKVLLNWGKVFPAASLPPSAAGNGTVPEPHCVTLVILAFSAWLWVFPSLRSTSCS